MAKKWEEVKKAWDKAQNKHTFVKVVVSSWFLSYSSPSQKLCDLFTACTVAGAICSTKWYNETPHPLQELLESHGPGKVQNYLVMELLKYLVGEVKKGNQVEDAVIVVKLVRLCLSPNRALAK